MRTPVELLARTDQLARALLVDPDETAGLDAFRGWHEVITRAAEAWRAAGQYRTSASPLDPFAAIEAMIENARQSNVHRADGTDARVTALTVQLDRLIAHYRLRPERAPQPAPAHIQRVQESLLHAGYLTTHAASLALRRESAATRKPALQAEIARAHETVGLAEQIFYVHLHQRPTCSAADQRLDTALTRWTATAHRILAEQPLEPKNNYIISDVQHGLLAHTAVLLAVPGPDTHDHQDVSSETRDRLLPALRSSADHWREVRHAWASLAAPTTGISRELADAARLLNQALRDPELDRRGRTGHLMAGTLSAAVGTARGLADAFGSGRLQAPTEVVVTMTRDVLSRLPDTNPYQVFMGMSRHEGRAPIPLPHPLRDDLTRMALRNIEAAQNVRSASHGLIQTSTHIPPTVYRVRSPSTQAADRALDHRPRDAVGPRR